DHYDTGGASPTMRIGLIGLGRMGFNMRARLRAAGHDVTGYDRDTTVSDVATIAGLASSLDSPRIVWVMGPAGDAAHDAVTEVSELLTSGDLGIDGGNSKYTDDRTHADLLAKNDIGYVDAGVSGGVWGRDEGYGLMVGGSSDDVAKAMPIFDALRPEGNREQGFSHAGPVGAGHYAKMVHNGIEYGVMQAFAEGFELLEASTVVDDVPAVITGWQRGTVVRSWLLDLLVRALDEDPDLDELEGYVEDSGEGRWTLEEAVNNAVPAPVMSAALFARFASRQQDSTAMRAVAALRNQFGGHSVKKADE